MNGLIQLNKATAAFFVVLGLGCFCLSSTVQAQLSPPPDGGYPEANTAEGDGALSSLTDGHSNTAIGSDALLFNTTGSLNTATGRSALKENRGGSFNTAVGFRAMENTRGSITRGNNNNTAVGANANALNAATLFSTSGDDNTAIGVNVLVKNLGSRNTAVGRGSLANNTFGGDNVALGFQAGRDATGPNNVYIGANMVGVAGETGHCYIASIDGHTAPSGVAVMISSNGKLGTITSSRRYKEDITPMNNTSEALFALKPVTFRYKQELDPQGIQQWGLVAEDVQRVNPALVALDKEGKPYSVRYEQVNAMLLNEFLKEHQTVQEQQKEIDALKAELKEQKALIQKVSDKVELNRPAPQMVVNNQ
jgi:hypothetical protein